MPETDKTLIAEALAGDQDAYRTLLERHRPAIFHIVFKFVREKEAAADLVQETFMKAFASLETYRSEYKFSTWLYRIAANSAIDFLRKQRIRTLSLDSSTDDSEGRSEYDVPDLTYHPERDLEERERRISIQDAIDSLPDKYRQVIIYRHKDDRSYEEIADALNIPIGTVKARIFRARELLKKKLKSM